MAHANAQQGLSLVELMVGLALGLLIAAAGSALLVAQLRETRLSLHEARLAQDLRGTLALMSRELRRAGHWSQAATAVVRPGAARGASNPYALPEPVRLQPEALSYRYARPGEPGEGTAGAEQFGFRLRGGVLETQLGQGNWQALTDGSALTVTAFAVVPRLQEFALATFCVAPCKVDGGTCPPRQQVRSHDLSVSATLVADPAVTVTMRSSVRLRNDTLVGACES